MLSWCWAYSTDSRVCRRCMELAAWGLKPTLKLGGAPCSKIPPPSILLSNNFVSWCFYYLPIISQAFSMIPYFILQLPCSRWYLQGCRFPYPSPSVPGRPESGPAALDLPSARSCWRLWLRWTLCVCPASGSRRIDIRIDNSYCLSI